MVGFILVADRPERDHVRRIVERLRPDLEQPVERRVQRHVRLRLADDHALRKAVLANARVDRSGEYARLE